MTYLRAKFQILSTNDTSVIAMRSEYESRFLTADMLHCILTTQQKFHNLLITVDKHNLTISF